MLPTPQRHSLTYVSDITILQFAADRLAAGQRVAIATLIAIDGPFSRPLGAQMAITEDGYFMGDVSNGCLESALALEALQLFQAADGERFKALRYGAGSPFIDIQLPCGGGLDILLDSAPEQQSLQQLCQSLNLRAVAQWQIPGTIPAFTRRYYPAASLLIAGNDPEALALALLARAAGYGVTVQTDSAAVVNQLQQMKAKALGSQQNATIDPFTAVVSLFHDHDRELPLLQKALTSQAFYVGALGSRRSQANRRAALLAAGMSYKQLAALHAPVGLIPRARDANTLAISILAEIAQSYQSLRLRLLQAPLQAS